MDKIKKTDIEKIKNIIEGNSVKVETLYESQLRKLVKGSRLMTILDDIFSDITNNIVDSKIFDGLDSNIKRVIVTYFNMKNIEIFDENELLEFEDNLEEDNLKFDSYDSFTTSQLIDYRAQAARTPLLTSEEEKDLFTRYKNGEKELKNRLIESNLLLVVSVARRYTRDDDVAMDLINEGNIGLIEAIDKFDPSMGYKFSTYAIWWIRQAITRALANKSRAIRIPSHMFEKINRVKRARVRIFQRTGKEATNEELCEELNIKEEDLEKILSVISEPVSLDEEVGETDHGERDALMNFVKDEKQNVENEAFNSELRDNLIEILSTLPEKERLIIELRYGLYDGIPKTLEEVGKQMGVTRERIRQIESKGLKKLRHPARASKIYDFIN